MESLLRVSLLGCVAFLSSCGLFGPTDDYRYEKPLIAVTDFENRVDFPLNWRLGEGIAEILENSLYETGSFRVLDRGDIDEVLKEQAFQAGGATRTEQSVPPNRLKNAHYLVKGVITEFAHVAMAGIDFGFGTWRLGGGGNYAIVSIAIKVTDVESGEVMFSDVLDGRIYAGGVDFNAVYDHVTLGGQAFYQTPLGHALEAALSTAVAGIQKSLPRRLWQPTIAEVDGEEVILAGGEDRRMEIGSRWAVRTPSSPVFDPRTGDVLGHEAGELVGVVRVTEVRERYSIAAVDATEEGQLFARGQTLERREAEAPP